MSDDGLPMTAEEHESYLAVIHGQAKPDMAAYRAGFEAHAAGRAFHEGPHKMYSVEGLSWRIGWNDRALAQPDKPKIVPG